MQNNKSSSKKYKIFQDLGLSDYPVLLAPLAGVSNYSFRKICSLQGADLTCVEMLSSVALKYLSKNTMNMAYRHHSEDKLAVQITSANQADMASDIKVLDRYPFDMIDINMGCPVQKVVKTGCGSAALKDPQKVYDLIKVANDNTDKPISAKIRIGWEKAQSYPIEVADACCKAGAVWLTVHGRLRSDNYSNKVDLATISAIKKYLTILVIGNGNLFSVFDIIHMYYHTNVDGVMISRGALGNPWVFAESKIMSELFNKKIFDQAKNLYKINYDEHKYKHTKNIKISIDNWARVVKKHISLHQSSSKSTNLVTAKRFRKNMLWYLRGWQGINHIKNEACHISTMNQATQLVDLTKSCIYEKSKIYNNNELLYRNPKNVNNQQIGKYSSKCNANDRWSYQSKVASLSTNDCIDSSNPNSLNTWSWDPKYDMDRKLDRGVQDPMIDQSQSIS